MMFLFLSFCASASIGDCGMCPRPSGYWTGVVLFQILVHVVFNILECWHHLLDERIELEPVLTWCQHAFPVPIQLQLMLGINFNYINFVFI